MTPTAFIDIERAAVTELARLSNDPALAFHLDPAFHPKFRNPDETTEDELEEVVIGSCPVSAFASTPAAVKLSRRSPKD